MKRKLIYLYRHPKDEMKDLTVCRNCGRPVEYGKLLNNTGHSACKICYELLRLHIITTKESNYEKYRSSEHLYIMEDTEYKLRCKELLNKQEEFISGELNKLK